MFHYIADRTRWWKQQGLTSAYITLYRCLSVISGHHRKSSCRFLASLHKICNTILKKRFSHDFNRSGVADSLFNRRRFTNTDKFYKSKSLFQSFNVKFSMNVQDGIHKTEELSQNAFLLEKVILTTSCNFIIYI